MQTFSIAVGDYNGYSFKVNPHNTAIVEFAYSAEWSEPGEVDPKTGEVGKVGKPENYNIIAEFNRNGGLIGEIRIPTEKASELRRDPNTFRPRRATEAELNAEEELRLANEQRLADAKAAEDQRQKELSDSRAKRVETPVVPVVSSSDAKPQIDEYPVR